VHCAAFPWGRHLQARSSPRAPAARRCVCMWRKLSAQPTFLNRPRFPTRFAAGQSDFAASNDGRCSRGVALVAHACYLPAGTHPGGCHGSALSLVRLYGGMPEQAVLAFMRADSAQHQHFLCTVRVYKTGEKSVLEVPCECPLLDPSLPQKVPTKPNVLDDEFLGTSTSVSDQDPPVCAGATSACRTTRHCLLWTCGRQYPTLGGRVCSLQQHTESAEAAGTEDEHAGAVIRSASPAESWTPRGLIHPAPPDLAALTLTGRPFSSSFWRRSAASRGEPHKGRATLRSAVQPLRHSINVRSLRTCIRIHARTRTCAGMRVRAVGPPLCGRRGGCACVNVAAHARQRSPTGLGLPQQGDASALRCPCGGRAIGEGTSAVNAAHRRRARGDEGRAGEDGLFSP
jgi:hypothetical protein